MNSSDTLEEENGRKDLPRYQALYKANEIKMVNIYCKDGLLSQQNITEGQKQLYTQKDT